jgi:hypothetical protein
MALGGLSSERLGCRRTVTINDPESRIMKLGGVLRVLNAEAVDADSQLLWRAG